jgi:hypothetical protein
MPLYAEFAGGFFILSASGLHYRAANKVPTTGASHFALTASGLFEVR